MLVNLLLVFFFTSDADPLYQPPPCLCACAPVQGNGQLTSLNQPSNRVSTCQTLPAAANPQAKISRHGLTPSTLLLAPAHVNINASSAIVLVFSKTQFPIFHARSKQDSSPAHSPTPHQCRPAARPALSPETPENSVRRLPLPGSIADQYSGKGNRSPLYGARPCADPPRLIAAQPPNNGPRTNHLSSSYSLPSAIDDLCFGRIALPSSLKDQSPYAWT